MPEARRSRERHGARSAPDPLKRPPGPFSLSLQAAGEHRPRETAIVVAIQVEMPALMRLALDIGFAGLALGIERVELEVEIMLARLAGIDRTALGFWNGRLHCPCS